MFFLKKKYFDKFKERYNIIRIDFVRPLLSDIFGNNTDDMFWIKIGDKLYYYEYSGSNPYTIDTYIDRPLTFGKLVDLLENAGSNAGKGFLVKLDLKESKNNYSAGRIYFEIINNEGNICLGSDSIKYMNDAGQTFKCSQDGGNETPVIFLKKNTNNYTGDIANILMTEDYFNNNIHLAIANLDLSIKNEIVN